MDTGTVIGILSMLILAFSVIGYGASLEFVQHDTDCNLDNAYNDVNHCEKTCFKDKTWVIIMFVTEETCYWNEVLEDSP